MSIYFVLNRRNKWENRFSLWGQYNYTRKSDRGIEHLFRSIVWKDGRLALYKPYLCYGGDKSIKIRRLSLKMTIKLFLLSDYCKTRDDFRKIKRFLNKKIF